MSVAAGDIGQIFREASGRVLAMLIARVGDFDLAEDAFQDAVATALVVALGKSVDYGGREHSDERDARDEPGRQPRLVHSRLRDRERSLAVRFRGRMRRGRHPASGQFPRKISLRASAAEPFVSSLA